MHIEVILVFYPLRLSLPIILSLGEILKLEWEGKAGNVVWPVLTLHTAWNDGKWDRVTQVCTISNGNAYCVAVYVVIVLRDWLEEAWVGREVRTQVRAAEEAWLPSICFAASYLVPTHPPRNLSQRLNFPASKMWRKKVEGKKQVGNCMLEDKEPASDAWTAPLSPLLHYWASPHSAGVLRSLTNQNQGTQERNYYPGNSRSSTSLVRSCKHLVQLFKQMWMHNIFHICNFPLL